MQIWKSLYATAKEKFVAWKAKKEKQYVTKEIEKTLKAAHATELHHISAELWPITKARQAQEIAAVRDGNLNASQVIDRRSWPFPYMPSSIARIRQPVIKMTPFNVRRFAKSPIPRRALNLIKYGVLSLEWDIVPKDSTFENADDDTRSRILAAKNCFNNPNGVDSTQSFLEACIEDFCLLGAGAIEPQITPDPERPWKMWSVDASTIRIFPQWTESNAEEQPRYAQMTGLLGERGMVPFMDDELLYIRDNVANDTPFGLGKMEVAFQSVTAFLGVQQMAGNAGSDQLHKTWLWWSGAVAPAQIDELRRHVVNDQEGQAKVSLTAGMPKPEILEIKPVQESDLLLNWQELLIRIICLAFDMSASAFLERDVNRSTGEVLNDKDFRTAVAPVAVKFADAFTRFIFHRLLGWKDLEFKFLNLDDPDSETLMKINQQLYAVNAITPNEIRLKMGMPRLSSPFADLTQVEVILLNTEATSNLQDRNTARTMQRSQDAQQQQQEQQMEMYQQYNQSQGGDQKAAAATAKAPKVPALLPPKVPSLKPPKAPSIPKLPMAGCALNAKQVSMMSAAELSTAMAKGLITADADFLCQQMETQEPGILDQMSEELQSYLAMLKKIQDQTKDKDTEEVSPEEKKAQQKLYKKKKHKPTFEEAVFNVNKSGLPKQQAKQLKNEVPR